MINVRVLLVDDHAIVREGIRALLAGNLRFEVVGEAGDGSSALAAVDRLQPDVVILDLSAPGLNGTQVTRALRLSHPAVKLLALSTHEERGYVRSLLDAGGAGYVLKRSALSEILNALDVVSTGGTYLDSSLTEPLDLKLAARRHDGDGHLPLSARERQVVGHVAHGFSNKEIADKLAVSVKTVETYRYRATDKLGLHSRADLVRYAIEQGWLAQA